MIVAYNGVSMLPLPLLCSSLKCRRKPVLLFSRENLQSQHRGQGRGHVKGYRKCPLCTWGSVRWKRLVCCNKGQNTVSCTNIFSALFSSEMETTPVEPLGWNWSFQTPFPAKTLPGTLLSMSDLPLSFSLAGWVSSQDTGVPQTTHCMGWTKKS